MTTLFIQTQFGCFWWIIAFVGNLPIQSSSEHVEANSFRKFVLCYFQVVEVLQRTGGLCFNYLSESHLETPSVSLFKYHWVINSSIVLLVHLPEWPIIKAEVTRWYDSNNYQSPLFSKNSLLSLFCQERNNQDTNKVKGRIVYFHCKVILLIAHASFLFCFFFPSFFLSSPALLISPRGLDFLVPTEEIMASGTALFEVPVRYKYACVPLNVLFLLLFQKLSTLPWGVDSLLVMIIFSCGTVIVITWEDELMTGVKVQYIDYVSK